MNETKNETNDKEIEGIGVEPLDDLEIAPLDDIKPASSFDLEPDPWENVDPYDEAARGRNVTSPFTDDGNVAPETEAETKTKIADGEPTTTRKVFLRLYRGEETNPYKRTFYHMRTKWELEYMRNVRAGLEPATRTNPTQTYEYLRYRLWDWEKMCSFGTMVGQYARELVTIMRNQAAWVKLRAQLTDGREMTMDEIRFLYAVQSCEGLLSVRQFDRVPFFTGEAWKRYLDIDPLVREATYPTKYEDPLYEDEEDEEDNADGGDDDEPAIRA